MAYLPDRPLEPCNASENPEAWAEIAEWERARACQFEQALRAERERCAQIAQKVSDHYTVLYNKARTDRDLLAGRQYYDGASDAADEIVEKIEERNGKGDT